MEYILEAEKLCKNYGKKGVEIPVLEEVDLRIKQGEFLSVMGPSGSGKSTLLYTVSGMDFMTSGRVSFIGRELSDLTEPEMADLRLREMGFVFQQTNLLKNFSIFDNILLSARMAGLKKAPDNLEDVRALMEKTGIIELADKDITQASGGQLQRAAICRALINQPQLLFGDEPTGALNSKAAGEIMDLLTGINQMGTTIMLVTHDVKVASRSERVLYMLDGQIRGELVLGKLDSEHSSIAREQRLSGWLMDMGW